MSPVPSNVTFVPHARMASSAVRELTLGEGLVGSEVENCICGGGGSVCEGGEVAETGDEDETDSEYNGLVSSTWISPRRNS